jgi:hypothetical protein
LSLLETIELLVSWDGQTENRPRFWCAASGGLMPADTAESLEIDLGVGAEVALTFS